MNPQRPWSVLALAWIYIAVGAGGFAAHAKELRQDSLLSSDGIWVEIVSLAAVVAGAFMLRGHNWARWLAIVWIAFHVAISAFHALSEFAVHCLFLVVFAWLLFRPDANRYFRRA